MPACKAELIPIFLGLLLSIVVCSLAQEWSNEGLDYALPILPPGFKFKSKRDQVNYYKVVDLLMNAFGRARL
ncbi:hypothetical protein Ciccas_004395 [Cichlidogyrus casuarinus]|uniref:Uncharacterized protein n=1 Tax=Cichlidogyrus casuarinus TaxID=1844966 RepID=A0ABD2QC40_9PLAT